MIRIDSWIANLSDGSTQIEEWLPGHLSPWQRLMDYCKKNRCYVTNLRLTIGNRTVTCKSNARGYWQAHGMPAVQGIECLVEGSLVHTPNGPKPIEQIAIGESVWSFSDGELLSTEVVGVIDQGEKSSVKITMKNRDLLCSQDHMVLKLKSEKTRSRGNPLKWSLIWSKASEISQGDYIVSLSKLQDYGEHQVSPMGEGIDLDYAYILGYMLGDGYVSNKGFVITEFGERREALSQIVKDRFGITGTYHPSHGVRFYSSIIRDDMIAMGFKELSHDKYIPQIIWNSPAYIKRAFLSGYFDADGHLEKNRPIKRYASCSRSLLEEVKMMHIELGDSVSNIVTYERKGDIYIAGRKVHKYTDLHQVEVYPYPKRNNRTFISRKNFPAETLLGDNFSIQRVESVEDIGIRKVYDLSIGHESHNYIANGIVNHNCDEDLHKWRGIGHVEGDLIHITWGARDPQTHQVVIWQDSRPAKNQAQVIWATPALAIPLPETDIRRAEDEVANLKKFHERIASS